VDIGSDPAERLLRNLRPEPRPAFVRELEAALAAQTRRRERVRVAVAGMAATTSIAALTLILLTLGLLPWPDAGADSTEAGTHCRTVIVVERERRPVLTVRPDGTLRTEPRIVTLHRPVTRCP
jgi:hypothetical protein